MFAPLIAYAGVQPFNDWFAPDTVQRMPLGTEIAAVDPFWGHGVFLYVKSADAILKGSVCMWNEVNDATLVPNTVNLGFALGVAMAPMAAGTFGWLQIAGRAVYKTNAAVAADAAIGIAAAGILGTNAAGKQVLATRNRIPATGTKTLVVNTQTNSSTLTSSGYDGMFLGMALSGAGIPAATVVAKLEPDGKTFQMGSAIGVVDKLATASATITLTGTYTGYGSGVMNRPFAQGAIT